MKIIENINDFFEARHPEAANEKMKFEVDVENKKIRELKLLIKKELDNLNTIKGEILQLENQIELIKSSLSDLEIEYAKELENIEQKYNQIERHIIQISELYKNSIDNDNIQISYSALKDRVNIFLKGWNAWLHAQLSVTKAKERSENARKVADIWLADNIKRKDDLRLNAA
jgi:septal ring factor EnvC (AmiA/AmiB activator)